MMMPSNSQRRALLANMNRVLETKVLTQKKGDWATKVPLFVSRDSIVEFNKIWREILETISARCVSRVVQSRYEY